MPMIPVETLDDTRLDAFRNLKDRTLATMGDLFIAEGEHVTRRLLAATDHQTISVLVAQNKAADIAPLVPQGVPLYVGSKELLSGVIGFDFHGGVLAVARRPASPPLSSLFTNEQEQTTILVCQQVLNDENLGSLIRIAAGFGAAGIVLGERSCDPYWRRAVRVSMGTVFSIPIIRSNQLQADLHTLHEQWQVELIATVLDDDARPLPESLRRQMPNQGKRIAILMGSESQGLNRWTVDHCQHKVTIPMQLGTDSLNVSMAAAVCLYHYSTQHQP